MAKHGEVRLAQVEQLLKEAFGDVRISHMEAKDLVNQGTTSVTQRISLSYEGEQDGLPESLIAKFCCADETGNIDALTLMRFRREIHFYQNIAAASKIEVPAYYGSIEDEARGQYLLLIEDLSDCHIIDDLERSSEMAKRVIAQLAKFHACWYQQEGLMDKGRYKELKVEPQQFAARYAKAEPEFIQAFGDLFTPVMNQLTQALSQKGEALIERINQLPVGLVHGDCHFQNMLFHASTERLVFIDWQEIAMAAPTFDLAKFLIHSFRNQSVQDEETELLQLYLTQLEANVTGEIDREEILNSYRYHLLQYWMYCVIEAIEAGEAGREIAGKIVASFAPIVNARLGTEKHLAALDALKSETTQIGSFQMNQNRVCSNEEKS